MKTMLIIKKNRRKELSEMEIKQLEVGNLMVFTYIIKCELTGQGLVIDPADETERIIQKANEMKCSIKYIVNTHAHVDHIMGNEEMKRLTGAQIVIHRDDADLLINQSPMMFRMFGGRPSPRADILVKEGDIIQVGQVKLRVIHTPGHSPGGICLYSNGALFTGDTLFVGGVGRTDLPGGSWKLLIESIKNKLLVLPDETIVYPGHNYGDSPTSTIGREKSLNPFLYNEI
jgi:glyoxylase-like metal-dependent hydrolase (beta-lactamase superfamily II)